MISPALVPHSQAGLEPCLAEAGGDDRWSVVDRGTLDYLKDSLLLDKVKQNF